MIYQFTTERGINMTARLVLEGDRYGAAGCLNADKPMVEFYCASRYHCNSWLKELYDLEGGLDFISRYYLETFLFGFLGDSSLERGVCLDGGAPQYSLEARECRTVAAHLFARLAGVEEEG